MLRIRVCPKCYDPLVKGKVIFYPSDELRVYVDSYSKAGVRVKIKKKRRSGQFNIQ